jgi:hypothetical protein
MPRVVPFEHDVLQPLDFPLRTVVHRNVPGCPSLRKPAPCVTDADGQAACPAAPNSYSNCCFTDTGQCYLGQGPLCGV